MVKFWENELKNSIAVTKERIKHMEKHGIGKSAMQEKATLLKQQKQLEDWRNAST